MSEIFDFDVTAANNNSAPPDGFPENMAYSAVNNAARELMAAMARWYQVLSGITTGGTGNDYTLTVNQTISSYAAGMVFRFKADRANTDALTLNVNALGAISVVDLEGQALPANAVVLDGIYQVVYDGTNFQLAAFVPNSRRVIAGNGLSDGGSDALSGDVTHNVDINGLGNITVNPSDLIAVYDVSLGLLGKETVANSVRAVVANEDFKGPLEIATQAETNAGTDDERAITPLKLANADFLIQTNQVNTYSAQQNFDSGLRVASTGQVFTGIFSGSLTHDFGSIPSDSTAAIAVTCTGCTATSTVVVSPRTVLPAGLSVYATPSTDQVLVRVVNATAGAVDPGSIVYDVLAFA